jgi:predicted nucleotidyltransferase
MRAFLTGSQVYGKPTDESDIDLVVLMDIDTQEQLLDLSGGKFPIKFGKLNIIAASTDIQYLAWLEAKRQCLVEKKETRKPLDKERAVEIHTKVREFLNVPYSGESEPD